MSIPSEVLRCKEWNGNNKFPEVELDKYTIEGIEAIHNNLITNVSWNATKPVATIVMDVGDSGTVTLRGNGRQ